MLDSADAVLIMRMANTKSIHPLAAKGQRKAFTDPERAFVMDDREATQGTSFYLPVSLSEISGLSGADLVFTWPSSDLQFEAFELADAVSAFAWSVKDGPGYVRISLSSNAAPGISGSAEVILLKFTATGTPSNTLNPAPIVRLNYAEVKGAYGDSYRWYGQLYRAEAEVTIIGEGNEGEGEGVVEGEGQATPEGEGEGEGAIEGEGGRGRRRSSLTGGRRRR